MLRARVCVYLSEPKATVRSIPHVHHKLAVRHHNAVAVRRRPLAWAAIRSKETVVLSGERGGVLHRD